MKDVRCQLNEQHTACAFCSFRGYTNKKSEYQLEELIYQLQLFLPLLSLFSRPW